jgi:hypothetical protein
MTASRVYSKQARVRSKVPRQRYGRVLVTRRRNDPRACFHETLVHEIATDDDDTLEFVGSNGDRVVVTLNDDERRQLEQAI